MVLLLELKLLAALRDFGSLSFSSGLASLPRSSWQVARHCQYYEKCHLVCWAEEMYFLTKKFILHRAAERGVGWWWRLERGHCASFPTHSSCSGALSCPCPSFGVLALAHTHLTRAKVLLPPGSSSRFIPPQRLPSQVGMGLSCPRCVPAPAGSAGQRLLWLCGAAGAV